MKFDDYSISDSIKKQLQILEYKKPTDIQFKAIEPILKGEDVLAIAQTGTGKTAGPAEKLNSLFSVMIGYSMPCEWGVCTNFSQ